MSDGQTFILCFPEVNFLKVKLSIELYGFFAAGDAQGDVMDSKKLMLVSHLSNHATLG